MCYATNIPLYVVFLLLKMRNNILKIQQIFRQILTYKWKLMVPPTTEDIEVKYKKSTTISSMTNTNTTTLKKKTLCVSNSLTILKPKQHNVIDSYHY